MYFDDKNVGYGNEEFYNPIDFQIKKLKEEKAQLEEYIRHLLFINKILEYILENNNYLSSKRKTFILEPIKQGCDNYALIEALNILLNDAPLHQKSFSLEEINAYSKKISNEISIAEGRINNIWSQFQGYGKDK